MSDLINAILAHYVPFVIILSMIVGTLALALAGMIRNSGTNDDVVRSNRIMKTVIVGFIMLFVSGSFVFAFNRLYVSKFYGGLASSLASKLPNSSDINNTDLLSSQVQNVNSTIQDPKCILIVVDTVDCIKKTVNDLIGSFIGKMVRGIGATLANALQSFNFSFLFALPADVFSYGSSDAGTVQRVINFNSLLELSEVIGLAWVYLLIVTHYFKSILFSLDNDYSADFLGDMGKMLMGFAAVFLARYMAEAVILTAQAFATFLFSGPLATGLATALQAVISDGLWGPFGSFGISLIGLALFVLIYIILFGFVVFRNAKRYFILLLMILLAPIFTPMLFFDMTRTMGSIFWHKFIVTSFSLTVDLIILLIVFVFLSSGGFSLGNLLLMLVGMAIVADSNNLLQQIALASEVSGFTSVVRQGVSSGTSTFMNLKRYLS